MQKLNIIFISSLLIVSNNFGMKSGIVKQDNGKMLGQPTIFEKAAIFSKNNHTTSLKEKKPRQMLGNINSGTAGNVTNDMADNVMNNIAGNITNNIERRFNQSSVVSTWVLSLSSDSNSNNVSTKKLYQEPIKRNDFSLLFENNGGEPVVSILTDSYVYTIFKQRLYSGNFDPNIIDNKRDSLLHRLIKQTKDYTKIKDVLRSGASVNAVDKEGKTSLWYAVTFKDQEMIDMLLHYGAVVHTNMLQGKSLSLGKVFCLQQCYSCSIHPENMSNIPCINQHTGMFICEGCYKESNKKCPLCKRSLDEYGK
jgi:ankyrin repeat protein